MGRRGIVCGVFALLGHTRKIVDSVSACKKIDKEKELHLADSPCILKKYPCSRRGRFFTVSYDCFFTKVIFLVLLITKSIVVVFFL